MPSQVTVTSKTGPASTVTALVLANATEVKLDLVRKVCTIVANGKINEFDLAATTTITDSISGGNHTIVVSQ